jgi:alpha-galactosidase
VILFNRGTEPAPIAATWEELGLGPKTRAAVRDLWKHADLGVTEGRMQATVAPHGVVMLRVSPQ